MVDGNELISVGVMNGDRDVGGTVGILRPNEAYFVLAGFELSGEFGSAGTFASVSVVAVASIKVGTSRYTVIPASLNFGTGIVDDYALEFNGEGGVDWFIHFHFENLPIFEELLTESDARGQS